MPTLATLLRTTAQLHGQRTAIRQESGDWTWDHYVDRIARTAAGLQALGLRPGDRFGVLARNSVAQAQLFNAGYWSGVVPVPLNSRLAPVEIAQMLQDAACKFVFVDAATASLLDVPALAQWKHLAIGLQSDDAGSLQARPCLEVLASDAAPLPLHEQGEDEEAIILFTGGTTGRAKGVRLSHRNVLWNAMQLAKPMRPCERDVYLHVSPMFHSTDLKATVVTMFGGSHAYLQEFSVEGVLRAVTRYGVSILSLVPTMIVRLLRDGRLQDHDLASLRIVSYGTSPIDEGVLRDAMQAFGGVGFHQCYGLTETAPLLAVLDEAAHLRALESRPELLRAAGRLLGGIELRLVDEEGSEQARGEPGEIVVRGPQVSAGYINAPDEQRSAFRDGWFHTGDLGRIDDEGYLHVLGRRKDMIITGGENVYTREVERVLEQHPAIAEVAVVGVPDPQFGQALLAALVPARGAPAPAAEALIDFCRAHLGGYKIPRRYLVLEQLPRTAVGKVRKDEIFSAWLASQEAAR